MIQFDIKRFEKLVRWTLTLDKRYYVKRTLQYFVIFTMIFLLFGWANSNMENGKPAYYNDIFLIILFLAFGFIVMGAGYMFYPMKGTYDRRTLTLLPASNQEKYLIRYATWLLLLPCALAAFLAADLVQYAVLSLSGKEGVMFETRYIADMLSSSPDMPEENVPRLVWAVVFLFLWLHSFFAVGVTFFHSHEFALLLTTLVLIAGWMLVSTILGGYQNLNALWWNHHGLFNRLFLVLTVVNFWLSYRLFCRWQVAGKYVNI